MQGLHGTAPASLFQHAWTMQRGVQRDRASRSLQARFMLNRVRTEKRRSRARVGAIFHFLRVREGVILPVFTCGWPRALLGPSRGPPGGLLGASWGSPGVQAAAKSLCDRYLSDFRGHVCEAKAVQT